MPVAEDAQARLVDRVPVPLHQGGEVQRFVDQVREWMAGVDGGLPGIIMKQSSA